MREIRSSGSVGGRGGNDPPYPDVAWKRVERDDVAFAHVQRLHVCACARCVET